MWVGAVVLAVLLKRAVGEVAAPWWTNAVYYRVLVDSFKDADGDGLGDIKGLTKQISYVRALGADAVILSPLSARSTDCSKPGITDFAEIDPRYGDEATFKEFIDKTKKIELKVVATLPLQTISAGSLWFTASADKDVGFEDRIVWRDGNADQMPPATKGVEDWVWHESRAAHFGSSDHQVILNLCSEGLKAALATAQCTWLKRGISGVLLKLDFPTNQRCAENLLRNMMAEAMSCARGFNLDTPVILVESSLRPELEAKYYTEGGVGANSILSKALINPLRRSAAELALDIYASLLTTPQDIAPTWTTSSSNQSRVVTRYGNELVDAINLLALILPGAAIIQQGDELGTADTILEWATTPSTCWPTKPVASAAPFPWDDTPNAGFTNGEPWLPIAPNYRYANAKTEFSNDNSHVGVVRIAVAMRKSPTMGPHIEIRRLGNALAILRWGGTGSLLVVANVARDNTEVRLSTIYGLPAELTVVVTSASSRFTMGSHVTSDKVMKLSPGETVMLAGAPRHCGGPGPVDKIANKLSEGWQKINKYFSDL